MTLSYITFILLSTIINLMIGAYLAILLGFGPPTPRFAAHLLLDKDDIEKVKKKIDAFLQLILSLFVKKEPVIESPIAEEKPAEIDYSEQLKQVEAINVNEFLDDNEDEIGLVAPLQEIFDEELASILMEGGTEAWLMNEKNVETSILKLNHVLMKSGRLAATLDKELRNARGNATIDLVEYCLHQLKNDCENYLEMQATTTQHIQERIDEFGELKYLAEDIEMSNMEQAAQVETTLSNLKSVSKTDPEKGINQLIKELSVLRVARHRLRDQQERAFITVSRYEERLDSINRKLYYDELVGIRGRIGLEVGIANWWKQNRQKERQLTFALVDIVRFGELNDEHGIHIGDAVLKYLGRSYEKLFDVQDIVAVYCGNCFLIATVHAGSRKTLSEIEKLRQTLERTTFTYNSEESRFNLLMTCGIVEVQSSQKDVDVYKMLDKTLKAAKTAGKNCTFFIDPKRLDPAPERIDPPYFGSDYIEVSLDDLLAAH